MYLINKLAFCFRAVLNAQVEFVINNNIDIMKK